MILRHVWIVAVLAVTIFDCITAWEVLNDEKVDWDNDETLLEREQFIPVARAAKPASRHLTSFDISSKDAGGQQMTSRQRTEISKKHGNVNSAPMPQRALSSPILRGVVAPRDALSFQKERELQEEGLIEVESRIKGRRLMAVETDEESEKNVGNGEKVGESLNFEEEDIDDICDDGDDIECLLRAEGLVMYRDEQGDSDEKMRRQRRVKRQSNNGNNENNGNNGNGNNGNGDDTNGDENQEESSGSEEGFYPDEEVIPTGTVKAKKVLKFPTTQTSLSQKEKEQRQQELQKQLETFFKNMTGFEGVDVTDVKIVNGTIEAEYELKVNGEKLSAAHSTISDQNDYINNYVETANQNPDNNIVIDGESPIIPISGNDVATTVTDSFNNHCESAEKPCSDGFSDCVNVGYGQGKCRHNCAIFEDNTPCQNGGHCELDENYNAYCECTRSWKGDTCETKKTKKKDLDSGEVTGITVAGALVCAGILGCLLFFLCRRSSRPVQFSYYGDSDQPGSVYSDPSSRLTDQFVIRRPQLKSQPVSQFRAPNASRV